MSDNHEKLLNNWVVHLFLALSIPLRTVNCIVLLTSVNTHDILFYELAI